MSDHDFIARRPLVLPLAAFACALLWLPGCTRVGSGPRGSSLAEGGSAEATEVSFHGWRHCCQLSNGLVRVTSVPQVGGRTLEYSLGPYNFLFLGRRELGTTLADHPDRSYLHFGGHFAQLHPEAKWRTLQSSYPPDLFMGAYEARILPAQDGAAAIEMTAPVDLATGTRLVRKVELFPGSTRVRLTDTLTNVRPVAQEWGLQDMLQLKGVASRDGVARGGERPADRLALYVPLNPGSRFPGGFRAPGSGTPGSLGGQWSATELPGILTLHYRRQFDKVVVDPCLPWIALADREAGCVFVQRCRAPEKAVLTAGPPLTDYPFIEVQCFGPLGSLPPGGATTLVQEWYAARCAGPVVDVTSAGVVASPLTLLAGGGKTWVAGSFGVFYAGRAAVVFRGADGAELARLDCGPVDPLHPFALNRAVELPPKMAEAVLELSGPAGKSLGHLGRILLRGVRP